jgi:hypothetical protein
VTRLDGGRPAGALRDVNPLTRKGAALFRRKAIEGESEKGL